MCSSVADNLKAGARLKPELVLEASVYFSDIEDFSSFVSELSPLQRLFSLTSSCICYSVRDNDVHELSPPQRLFSLTSSYICSSVRDNDVHELSPLQRLFSLTSSYICSSVRDNDVHELSPLQRLFSLTSSCICSSVRDNDVHELSPLQIVDLLGRLWIMFDDVIAKHNVYKVSVPYLVQTSHIETLPYHSRISLYASRQSIKAKFHYAIWFDAGRRQVRRWSATSFEPVCDQLRTIFEPDSVMEFGREPASSC